ncbi:MAG: PAS domain-containing protein, partial [Cyanobacteria bacterium]|nr:PAS domain-containing protein [Cyanobacteriota bacterium]
MTLLLVQSSQLEWQASKAEYYRELTAKGLQLASLSYRIITSLSRYYENREDSEIRELPSLLSQIRANVSDLDRAVRKDPVVSKSVKKLVSAGHELDQRFTDATLLLANKSLTLPEAERLYQHKLALSSVTRELVDGAGQLAELARSQETRSRSIERKQRQLVRTSVVASAVFNVVLCIGLLYLFALEFRDRLATVVENTRRFSDDRELLAPLDGKDEVAELDRFFHEMAVQVRSARQRETALVDNAADVICSLDSEGVIQARNPAGAERIGDIKGVRLADFVDKEMVEDFQSALARCHEHGLPVTLDMKMNWVNGESQWCTWSITRVSEPLTYFLVSTDLTDRKELERVRKEFYAMITHDMRTPLQAALLSMNMLSDGLIGEPVSDGVRHVSYRACRSLSSITHLIDDLLDIEKLESGEYELDAERVELNLLVDDAIESVGSLIETKRIAIDRKLEDATVCADKRRIFQVATNLISNAIKFTPEAGKITVSCNQHDGFTEVRVKDSGPGIAPENHTVIFKRFRQLRQMGQQYSGDLIPNVPNTFGIRMV